MPKKSKLKQQQSPARMEPDEAQLLSTPAFAKAIGVTRQHVSRLVRAGIITKHSRGRFAVTEIAKVLAFREGGLEPGDDPEAMAEVRAELTLERTLLVKAQREKAELELAFRRGEMVNRAEEESKAIELVVNTRNRLLSVAERVAGRFGLKRHEVAVIDEEIRTALTELSQLGEAAS
jgi:phage terminase Nu1 subunit (DNA packaging protein)